jgi:hypothetical protein
MPESASEQSEHWDYIFVKGRSYLTGGRGGEIESGGALRESGPYRGRIEVPHNERAEDVLFKNLAELGAGGFEVFQVSYPTGTSTLDPLQATYHLPRRS